MQIDWTILEHVGLGGVSLFGIFVFYKTLMFFLNMWKQSTEALNRNTDAYNQLSNVFEKSHEKDLEFQKEMMLITKETHEKVNEIHKQVIQKGD